MNTAPNELVTLNETEGTITTTSRIIAETYGKRHTHVIRDIEELITSIDELETQEELPTRPKFGLSEYRDDSGKINKMYLLDRNAWTLLVMGYTGVNATRFKLRYIGAFDAMESKLKSIIREQLSDAKGTIRKRDYWLQVMEKNQKALFNLTDAAGHVGIPVGEMTKALRDRGYFKSYQYNDNEPLQILQDGHLFIVNAGYQSAKMKYPSRQTHVTWAGILWIKGVLEAILIEKGIVDYADTGYYNDF